MPLNEYRSRCLSLGGDFQGKHLPQIEEEILRCKTMGIKDINSVLTMEDIIKGEDAFLAATGVTDGELLKGVQYRGDNATTHSVVFRAKTGTLSFIEGEHSIQN